VESFLEDADTYDIGQKRWLIPETLTKRETLVDTLYSILLLVVQRFVKPNEPGVKRHLFNIQGYPQCEQKGVNGHAICPVLIVPAMGPSFELPQALHSVPRSQLAEVNLGYSCMATYFTVKLEANMGSDEEQVHEMETYARYGQPQHTTFRRLTLIQADSVRSTQQTLCVLNDTHRVACTASALRLCRHRDHPTVTKADS
jgi:hypothetical protein